MSGEAHTQHQPPLTASGELFYSITSGLDDTNTRIGSALLRQADGPSARYQTTGQERIYPPVSPAVEGALSGESWNGFATPTPALAPYESSGPQVTRPLSRPRPAGQPSTYRASVPVDSSPSAYTPRPVNGSLGYGHTPGETYPIPPEDRAYSPFDESRRRLNELAQNILDRKFSDTATMPAVAAQTVTEHTSTVRPYYNRVHYIPGPDGVAQPALPGRVGAASVANTPKQGNTQYYTNEAALPADTAAGHLSVDYYSEDRARQPEERQAAGHEPAGTDLRLGSIRDYDPTATGSRAYSGNLPAIADYKRPRPEDIDSAMIGVLAPSMKHMPAPPAAPAMTGLKTVVQKRLPQPGDTVLPPAANTTSPQGEPDRYKGRRRNHTNMPSPEIYGTGNEKVSLVRKVGRGVVWIGRKGAILASGTGWGLAAYEGFTRIQQLRGH